PWTSVRSHAAWEGWDEALADFLRLHRLSKVGKARFMDGRMEEFFRDSTRTLAAAGWARLWFLDWDGAAVASFLCLEYGGSVGLYNSRFDPTHPKLPPRLLLLAPLIRDPLTPLIPPAASPSSISSAARNPTSTPSVQGLGNSFACRCVREPARRDTQRTYLSSGRPRRQGDGRHERLCARDGARALAHGRRRGRVHA